MTDDTSQGPQDDVVSIQEGTDPEYVRDRDGVSSLRDTSEESGDEDEVTDAFDLDRREASELGVQLDSDGGEEASLD
jgi:hypothetical protein